MKKRFALLGAMAIGLISFCLAVILGGSPSDAVTSKYKALISAGVIDAVVEPSELGLDYLREQPPELAASDIAPYIQTVNAQLASNPEDLRLDVPLCTNGPIQTGQYPNDDRRCASQPGFRLVAEAIIDSNGNPTGMTSGLGVSMTDIEAKHGGNIPPTNKKFAQNIPNLFSESRNRIVLADASGSFKMAQNVAIVNLVAYSPQNGRRYILRNVNANAFCRDLLNGALNETLIRRQNRRW